MKLTSTQYVEDGAQHCPFCGSEDFKGGSVEISSGSASQQVTCSDCEKSWLDEYKLVGYMPMDD